MSKVNPKVSVVMITYNHEPYIKQAIEGVLAQDVEGVIELIIADDNSPDNTEQIVKSCIKNNNKFNIIINYIKHHKNKGMMPNFIWALSQAKGKYIALCEGDDYWTDHLKLQKQVDVLEQNENINICLHPCYSLIECEIIDKKYGYWGDEMKLIQPEKMVSNYITAGLQSIMFRNINVDKFSDIIKKPVLGGHSSLQIYYGLLGEGAVYLPDYMAVYRVNSSSSVSKVLFKKDEGYLNRQIGNLHALDRINTLTKNKFKTELSSLKYRRISKFIKETKIGKLQFLKVFIKHNMYLELEYSLKLFKNYFKKKL